MIVEVIIKFDGEPAFSIDTDIVDEDMARKLAQSVAESARKHFGPYGRTEYNIARLDLS